MLEIPSVHGRQYFCLLFLVGMLLHFATNPSLSSKLNMTSCNENDRAFLLDILPQCTTLYNNSFLLDCCSWPGISCSNLTGRIIGLDLSVIFDSNLCDEELLVLGEPSHSLDDLTSLQLDLGAVVFTKGFPSFIRSFPNLRHLLLLYFDYPRMVIPQELGNLTRLETLEVNPYYPTYSYFDTTMYASTLGMLSRLTSLKRLVLYSVSLDNATDWLHVVSNLPHLEHLDLRGCSLPYVIRHSQLNVNSSKSLAYLNLSYTHFEYSSSWSWIFNQSSLISLSLSHNELAGPIPNSFRGMRYLSHLDLSYNNLESSSILSWIFNHSSLVSLFISNNQLSGPIPNSFRRMTSLSYLAYLDLSYNNLESSSILSWIFNHSSLVSLFISNNQLSGPIPNSFRRMTSLSYLAYLDLSYNNLESSSILSWIFNHSSLVSLFISNNQLSGPIPNSFRGMTSLSDLDLSSNRLEGPLPSFLGGCCGLRSVDVSQNHHLQGDLSSIFRSLSCANKSLTTLSMHRNLFSGSLPDFTMFSSLSKLRLHSNKLNGSLPSYFRSPSSLAIFDVHNNQLTGPIPDLSVFRSLKVLQLRNNKLNGSVHPGLGQLSMLRHLDISSNSLKGDLGISHLANLSSLRYFDISSNSLTLNVGSSWVPQFHLDTIALASCDLGSRFPGWLQTQTDYSVLDLSNTGISDTIPFWFWNLSSVATFIILSHNRLHGKLPTDFPFVFGMKPSIDLSFNFLEGTIPSSFGNAEYLNLSRNGFSGTVSFLCQSPFLSLRNNASLGIDLSHNNLSGELPDCWSDVWTISVLDLSNNSFSGQLPSSLANLSSLQSLHLRNNKFSGKLPLSLCNLTDLSFLDLGDNLFSGEIPGCLGHTLKNLTVLSLQNNSISGSIPPQLCHPSIQILDLSMNNISGVIPQCLCKLQAMTQKKSLPIIMYDYNGTFSTIGRTPYKDYISLVLKGYLYNDANHLELVKSLDLSGNNLRGDIPGEISCLTGLISLNFSRNNLSGSITSKIGSLKSLESLDLSNNHLSGEIPSTISDLNFLGTLCLANNNFSGRIPAGTQIQGFNASVFAGNPWLCGEPLTNKCPGDGDGKGPSINEDHQNPKDNNAFDLGLYISVVLGFITGFWAFCGVLLIKRSWRIAYFRAWIHLYDKLYVVVTLMLVRIRRRYLA